MSPETTDRTVRIIGKSFDDVVEIVYGANLPNDFLVHGKQDGSTVFVTGSGDVKAIVEALGLIVDEAFQ